MTRLSLADARCEALFVSGLQRSDAPTAEAVAEVISRTVRQFGVSGCATRMAQEFGDHPEEAADRMRWVRQLADEVFAPRPSRRARLASRAFTRPAAFRARPAAAGAQRAA
jgi:hypothetical protein